MSDGIAEMNREKSIRIMHTTLSGITVEVVGENKDGNTCRGCCFWDGGCAIRGDEVDTDLCSDTNSIFKEITPLDKATADLAAKDTPLVADVRTTCTDVIRTFESGATRDTDEGKPRYHGYNCPLADQKFGEYMLGHQNIGTDKERPAGNWKNGFPLEEVLESLIRHVKDLELHHDGYADQCRESDIHEVLGGIRANGMFYHSEICKKELLKQEVYNNVKRIIEEEGEVSGACETETDCNTVSNIQEGSNSST